MIEIILLKDLGTEKIEFLLSKGEYPLIGRTEKVEFLYYQTDEDGNMSGTRYYPYYLAELPFNDSIQESFPYKWKAEA